MPLSSQIKQPEISRHIRLLEIAQRAPIFLSQALQPFVVCPSTATASPLYSEDFFGWIISAVEKQLGAIPSLPQFSFLLRALDAQARNAQTRETVHIRTAKTGTKSYQIDIGTPNQETIEITGQEWKVSQFHDVRFQRLETAQPLPIPERCEVPAAHYLQQMYNIPLEDGYKLARWLAEAMLPEQKPPILVITGTARDEAVEQLRSLIDPVISPIIEMPATSKQMAQQAVENRILAYSIYNYLPEKTIQILNSVRYGMRARLKQANKNFTPLYDTVHRPIIISAEEAIKISNHQIHIEINKTHIVKAHEFLGALLDVVVQIVSQPAATEEPMVATMPQIQGPIPDPSDPNNLQS